MSLRRRTDPSPDPAPGPEPDPVRPRGEWAEVGTSTAVLPRRPRGVVPHADFRASLGTTWTAPPALQPLGHHLTLDAPPGLLTAAAVPVEAYAGAPLRFTPATAVQPEQPAEPTASRQRLIDRVLRRPSAPPSSVAPPWSAVPPGSAAPPWSAAPPGSAAPPWPAVPPRSAAPPSSTTPPPAAPRPAQETPGLRHLPDQPGAGPTARPDPRPQLPEVEHSHRSGPARVVTTTPPAGPLHGDPAVVVEPRTRSGPVRREDTPPQAGPVRVAQASVRPLLGHRALGADLVAAAAEVVLPRPVAALAPVALPAPVASRVTAAPRSERDDLAPPRLAGLTRPVAGRAAPTTPAPGHPPYPRAVAAPPLGEVPSPVEGDIGLLAAPVAPVEPVPGLPDWWPAESTTWTVADAEPDSAPVDRVAGPPESTAGRADVALPDADPPEAAGPGSTTHAAPVVQRRTRPTRDPATGMPVTRRVGWPLDLPAEAGPSDRNEPHHDPDHDQPDQDRPDRPARLPGPVEPGLRRVVRATSVRSPDDGQQPTQGFPLIGPSDVPGLRHRIEPPEPPELPWSPEPPEPSGPAPWAATDQAAGDGPAAMVATPATAAAGPGTPRTTPAAAAATAEDVGRELRHALLVERERYGVLADLW